MKYKAEMLIAGILLYRGFAVAVEIPSEQSLVEIRSQRSGAEMRAKAMPVLAKIVEFRRSATKQDKCELERRISTVLLDAPPTFGDGTSSLTLRTKFVKMMPAFDVLQPDALLWDALADHLRAAAYVPQSALDSKMAEAKAKDERLIAEGKITRPPCHFGYPNTPNMAMVRRERIAAENWNIDIASYRLSLLKKYATILARHLHGLDEGGREQFRRLFLERARLSPKEDERFFGVASELGNDVNVGAHKKESR